VFEAFFSFAFSAPHIVSRYIKFPHPFFSQVAALPVNSLSRCGYSLFGGAIGSVALLSGSVTSDMLVVLFFLSCLLARIDVAESLEGPLSIPSRHHSHLCLPCGGHKSMLSVRRRHGQRTLPVAFCLCWIVWILPVIGQAICH
jgi:hypothetical protein